MKKIALLTVMLLLAISVLQCSGGESGGGGGTDPVDPGPLYFITGTITSPSGWGIIPEFTVRHEGTRDVGGFSSGSQAMYPCDNVTCDCVGTCTYIISQFNGTYDVTVRISPSYGDYVSTPLSRTVVVGM
jgi:hypothetical protein